MAAGALALWMMTAQAPPEALVRPDDPDPARAAPAPPMLAVTPPDLVPPVVPARVWRAERRRLQVQTALSWTFAALGLVGLTTSLVLLGTCPDAATPGSCPHRQGLMIAAPIFAVVTAGALVPAAIFTDRLVYHRVPRRELQLGLGVGGLLLRF